MIDRIKYMEPKALKALVAEVAKYRHILINCPELRGADLKKWFQFKDLCEKNRDVALMALQTIMDAYMLNRPNQRYLYMPERKDFDGQPAKVVFGYTYSGNIQWKLTLKALDTFDGTLVLADEDNPDRTIYIPLNIASSEYIVDIIAVLRSLEPEKMVTQ